MKKLLAVAALLAGIAGPVPANANPVQVDVELSLVVDISGSINNTEYNLQMQGYVDAFESVQIQDLIEAGNGIAVNMIMFAQDSKLMIGWTLLQTATDADNFASAIANLVRPNDIGSSTDIEDGLTRALFGDVYQDFGVGEVPRFGVPDSDLGILTNDFEGERLVVDVSGDGEQNVSNNNDSGVEFGSIPRRRATNDYLGDKPVNDEGTALLQAARNDAESEGVTVNGLAIVTNPNDEPYFPDLDMYYQDNLLTSDGFVIKADGFSDFGDAVEQKIFREISGPMVPEPSSIAVFGTATLLLGLGVRRRRTRKPC